MVCTPNKKAMETPVTKEVQKTMRCEREGPIMDSYARMSTHLLSPLMEYDEDNHSSFVGSYAKFEPCEYVWYDVEVTNPDGVSIVNSRIGSVNNTAGLYAIVGPMGLSAHVA